MTPRELELLKQIGPDGCYASDISDDDETCIALGGLQNYGLIFSSPARFDDYFKLSKAGRAALTSRHQNAVE